MIAAQDVPCIGVHFGLEFRKNSTHKVAAVNPSGMRQNIDRRLFTAIHSAAHNSRAHGAGNRRKSWAEASIFVGRRHNAQESGIGPPPESMRVAGVEARVFVMQIADKQFTCVARGPRRVMYGEAMGKFLEVLLRYMRRICELSKSGRETSLQSQRRR